MASKTSPIHHFAETSIGKLAKKARSMSTDCSMRQEFEKHADYLNQLVSRSNPAFIKGVCVYVSVAIIAFGLFAVKIWHRQSEPVYWLYGPLPNLSRFWHGPAEHSPVYLNDKRERVVKASRDLTINSKKVIFQVHRINKYNKEDVLEKAEKDLAAVTDQHLSKLVKELQGSDFWKLRRAYTPGVQEYVEAATFCRFCKNGNLLDLAEINDGLRPLSDPSLEPLQINLLDYLLGLADVTGELMRFAIARISDGDLEYAENICRFVRDIYRELMLLVPKMDDNSEMNKKMEVMLQSVMKIENACCNVRVRGSEYIPSLGSCDTNFMFLGVPDLEV